MTIRHATALDMPRIDFLGSEFVPGWGNESIKWASRRGCARLRVVEANGVIVGFVWTELRDTILGGRTEIAAIAVHPRARKQGHGRALIEAAKINGGRSVNAMVPEGRGREMLGAHLFFKACGFRYMPPATEGLYHFAFRPDVVLVSGVEVLHGREA